MGEKVYQHDDGLFRTTPPKRPEDRDIFALNPFDAFEAALIDIVEMKRRKGKDYDKNENIFTNFQATAHITGLEVEMVLLVNVAQKMARLNSLRANGRMKDPSNEATIDSYLDLAVYAVILLAFVKAFDTSDDDDGSDTVSFGDYG